MAIFLAVFPQLFCWPYIPGYMSGKWNGDISAVPSLTIFEGHRN